MNSHRKTSGFPQDYFGYILNIKCLNCPKSLG